MQFFCGRAARAARPLQAFSGARALPDRGGREAGVDTGRRDAARNQSLTLPLLALLRCVPDGIPACRVSRQRNSPALGYPRTGERPMPHWAVFRLIEGSMAEAGSQISVLRDGDRSLLYCCHSMRVRDMAGNPHVLSVGVDLAPALDSN